MKGSTFLGQNIRKYDGKLLIKPSKENVKAFLDKVRKVVKSHQTTPQADLIKQLNPKIQGWAHYHRHVVAKETFQSVDNKIWQTLWRWAKRRHPNKSTRWVKDKYFISEGNRNWVFAADIGKTLENGKPAWVRLRRASDVPIRRHIQAKVDANPFDYQWEPYFEGRLTLKMKNSLTGRRSLLSLWLRQEGNCPVCSQKLTEEGGWHVHHILPRAKGGDNRQSNLWMLHPNCHRQIHSQGFNVVKPVPA